MWRKYTAYFETTWKRSYHHCFLYVSRYAELHTHTHTSLYLIGIKALILPKGDVAVIPSSNTDSCDWIMRVLTVEALLFTFVIIVVSLLKLLCPALCFLLSYSHWFFLFCFVLCATLMVQAPRTAKGVLRSGKSFGKDSPASHWQSIIDSLSTFLSTLKENFVRNL